MNANALVHLAWKEYRALRGFWLAMIVLAVLLEWFVVATYVESSFKVTMIYSLALGVPAFFALGCAGTAFAVEREEGTFEFLRSAPTSSREVLVSKLLVVVLATALMYGVLWLIALWLRHHPTPAELRGLLGVWVVAAVEAIAWGTLFSMLSARPLVAVVMGLVAASVSVHLLVWSTIHPPIQWFAVAPYLTTAPRRIVVAAAVLAIDVVLGLQWFDGAERMLTRGAKVRRKNAARPAETARDVDVTSVRSTPVRSSILYHLVWQSFRQSRWLMVLFFAAIVWSTLVTVIARDGSFLSMQGVILIPALLLCGAVVFLPDQERSRFRFFAEHNVPPRSVWLARHLPWLTVLGAAMVAACVLFLLDKSLGLGAMLEQWKYNTSIPWSVHDRLFFIEFLRYLLFALSYVPVAYAVGQWCSMMIRSGVLAGFCAVLINGALAFWCALMAAWHVGWWWSVLPIPLVLMWATWRRAPDSIRENTTWPARLRVARDVLLPAVVLSVAMPWYRVHEIPVANPGFDPTAFQEIVVPRAIATGALYKRADELYSTDGGDNSESLALVLEASQRTECLLEDPRRATSRPGLRNGSRLVRLVTEDAERLVRDGKLAEALERLLSTIRTSAAVDKDRGLIGARGQYFSWLRLAFGEISSSGVRMKPVGGALKPATSWAQHKDQTPASLRDAIQRLAAIDSDILELDNAIKWEYVVVQRYLAGDATAWPAMFHYSGYDLKAKPPNILWPRLAPWETYRGERELNARTNVALKILKRDHNAAHGTSRIGSSLPLLTERGHWNLSSDPLGEEVGARERTRWFASITPDVNGITDLVRASQYEIAEFEALRRGAMLQLALEAFHLEHGSLPYSLDELVGPYLETLPRDPYTGDDFRYFRSGIPKPATESELRWMKYAANYRGTLPLEVPSIWCTGPELISVLDETSTADNPRNWDYIKSNEQVYYMLRTYNNFERKLPFHVAWARGMWFPIPEPRKDGAGGEEQGK